MGLRSKLKKALGGVVQSLPGQDNIQKVIGKDPIAQMVMKVDPLARDIGDVHGLSPGAAAAAADATPVEGRNGFQPPVRNTSWQSERVAALRSKFGRPGAAATMPLPVSATPPTPAAMPTVPAMPAMPQANAITEPIKTTMPINPAAQDVEAYSQSWDQANNRY